MGQREGTELGRTVRRLRLAAGLTQEALARAAGVTMGTVTRLERYGGEELRLGTLRALRRALGCTLEELVGPDPAPAEPAPSPPPLAEPAPKRGRRKPAGPP